MFVAFGSAGAALAGLISSRESGPLGQTGPTWALDGVLASREDGPLGRVNCSELVRDAHRSSPAWALVSLSSLREVEVGQVPFVAPLDDGVGVARSDGSSWISPRAPRAKAREAGVGASSSSQVSGSMRPASSFLV